MEQSLEIFAINISNRYGRNFKKEELPEKITIKGFDETLAQNNLERIFNILERCDKEGTVINNDSIDILVPKIFIGEKEIGEFFRVKQILYREKEDWSRFEFYNEKGLASKITFNQYVMDFGEFQLRGRPKEISLDYHKNVYPKMNFDKEGESLSQESLKNIE